MKVQYYSDIHEEFVRKSDEVITEFPGDKDTVLILAGDIDVKYKSVLRFVNSFSDQFKAVIFVLGNHDLWGHSLLDYHKFESELDNVHLLQNSSIQIEDVVFLGGTLWTDYNKENAMYMFEAHTFMRDFRKIKRIVPENVLAEHKRTRAYIESVLSNRLEGLKYFVVTHHAPSYQLLAREFSSVSPSYYSDMDELVKLADYWVYGHTHHNVNIKIGNCKVMSNQLGYRPHYEVKDFDNALSIEV